MDVVVKFAAALVFLTLLHKDDAAQCYECSSQTARGCGRDDSPNHIYLKDSGNNAVDVCYELNKIDPDSGKTITQRGILPRDGNNAIARMCLGSGEGVQPRATSIPLQRPRNSTNRKPNTLSGQAWNNLQQSKILSKRSANNPDTLLKEESEGDEYTISTPVYNCTSCSKSKCNWKTSEDDISMDSYVTAGVDDELVVNKGDNITTELKNEHETDSSTRFSARFISYILAVIIAVRII